MPVAAGTSGMSIMRRAPVIRESARYQSRGEEQVEHASEVYFTLTAQGNPCFLPAAFPMSLRKVLLRLGNIFFIMAS